jgi:hypothetical protein
MITLTKNQLEQALKNRGYLEIEIDGMEEVTLSTPHMQENYAAVYSVTFKPTMYDEPDADLQARVYVEYRPNGQLIADF